MRKSSCLRTFGLLVLGAVFGIFVMASFVTALTDKTPERPAANLAVLAPTVTPVVVELPTVTPVPPAPLPKSPPTPFMPEYALRMDAWLADVQRIGNAAEHSFNAPQYLRDMRRLRGELNAMQPIVPFLDVHATLVGAMESCVLAGEYAVEENMIIAGTYLKDCAYGFASAAEQLEALQ